MDPQVYPGEDAEVPADLLASLTAIGRSESS
jgi:hypothetical protein